MFQYSLRGQSAPYTRRHGLLAKPCGLNSLLLKDDAGNTANILNLLNINGLTMCDKPVSKYPEGDYHLYSAGILACEPFLMAPCTSQTVPQSTAKEEPYTEWDSSSTPPFVRNYENQTRVYIEHLLNPIYGTGEMPANARLYDFCPEPPNLSGNITWNDVSKLFNRYIFKPSQAENKFYGVGVSSTGSDAGIVGMKPSSKCGVYEYWGGTPSGYTLTLKEASNGLYFISIKFDDGLTSSSKAKNIEVKIKVFGTISCFNAAQNLSDTFVNSNKGFTVCYNRAKYADRAYLVDGTAEDHDSLISSYTSDLPTHSSYDWLPKYEAKDMIGDCYFYFQNSKPSGVPTLVKISDIWENFYLAGSDSTLKEYLSSGQVSGNIYRGELIRYGEQTWKPYYDTLTTYNYLNVGFGITTKYTSGVAYDVPVVGYPHFMVAIEVTIPQ